MKRDSITLLALSALLVLALVSRALFLGADRAALAHDDRVGSTRDAAIADRRASQDVAQMSAPGSSLDRSIAREQPTNVTDESAPAALGRIDFVVRDRSTGAIVPHARIWALKDEILDREVDANGRTAMEVPAGTYSGGAEPASGAAHRALPYDVDTGNDAAETEIEVVAGQAVEAALVLHRGATIEGIVIDAQREPVPEFQFVWLSADGDRWITPKRIRTDAGGRFRIAGLEAGWYLLGPEPDGEDVFGLERMELQLGETRSVTMELARRHEVTLRVRLVQDGETVTDGPPLNVIVTRGDGLGDLARPTANGAARKRSLGTTDRPFEWTFAAPPGPYDIVVLPSSRVGEEWLIHHWNHAQRIDVTDANRSFDLEIERPAAGPYVTIDVLFSTPFQRGTPRIRARAMTRFGVATGTSLLPRIGGRSVRLHIDRTYVTSDTIEFVRSGETFAAAGIGGGDQQVTITPPAD